MSKTDEIRKLLEMNKQALKEADKNPDPTKTGFSYDGIICESEFEDKNNNNKKLIFLLKEVNACDAKGNEPKYFFDWDYRYWLEYQQFLNKEDTRTAEERSFGEKPGDSKFYRKSFNNIAMWVDQFHTQDSTLSFEEYVAAGRREDENKRKQLGKTAIVNLKKTWGGGSTPWDELNHYLSSEVARDVVRKQIDIIAPDVVICGGKGVTFDFAKIIFKPQKIEKIQASGKEYRYFKYGDAVFIDFYHPSCWNIKAETLYNYAKHLFAELNNV